MDRVQPLDTQISVEAFTVMEKSKKQQNIKNDEIKDEIIFNPIRQFHCGSPLDGDISYGEISLIRYFLPRLIVTMENDPLDHFPHPNFDNLWKISTFLMDYTSKSTCKIFSPTGDVLFKGIYPRSIFCESCQSEVMDKTVEVIDPQNSDVMMILKYTTPAFQICYEQATTIIEILEPDGNNIIAKITQKKTWMNARISRDVMIQPGSFGKSNIYIADFTSNDTSVNFKTNRSGLIVATLIKNFSDTDPITAYTLQILREIKPRDKAILVGFMMARDLLMIDETQTQQIVKKMTSIIVFIFVVVVLMYILVLTLQPESALKKKIPVK